MVAVRTEVGRGSDMPAVDTWLHDLAERAHQDTVRAATSEVAATVQGLFGQRMVAFMTGVDDPKAVGRWA
ncbi:MAG: hypothetical protein K0Q71_5089, partial [Thermomicrobiales bacterium]|nr:hypothetical protein [Thermomicrobiales bacterium]